MYFYNILNQVLILFLIIVIGYLGRKLNVYDDKSIDGLTGILLNIALPALLVNSINSQAFSKDMMLGGIK